MKKIILFIIFALSMFGLASAQSAIEEFEKVKVLKLLESDIDDVYKIFPNYFVKVNSQNEQMFHTQNANIGITYSSGNCSEETYEWNVPEWKVTKVSFTFRGNIPIKDVGINYSKFKKERLYKNEPNSYVYHNKEKGVALEVIDNDVQRIYLFPSKKDSSLICDNETIKDFYKKKKWFLYTKLKERIIDYNHFADVVDLSLSTDNLIFNCADQNENVAIDKTKIKVLVKGEDPEGDVLIYQYEISGGKIIGSGSSVIWDLSDVKTGTYEITAGVDDGCGICGKTMTKTVIVKNCLDD